jgi:hypothetical protein
MTPKNEPLENFKELEKQWREEFEKHWFSSTGDLRQLQPEMVGYISSKNSSSYKATEVFYLEACKKAQEELEKRDKLLKEALPVMERANYNAFLPNSFLEKWLTDYKETVK